MSRSSEYTLDLIVKGDEAREAISRISRGLDEVTQSAKKSLKGVDIGGNLKQASEQAKKVAIQLNNAVRATENNKEVIQAYTRGMENAEKTLQSQVAQLKFAQSEEGKLRRQERERLKTELETTTEKKRKREIENRIKAINKEVVDLSDEELTKAIEKNRQIRITLRNSLNAVKMNQANAKVIRENTKAIEKAQERQRKLADLQFKRDTASNKVQKAWLTLREKMQQAYIKGVETLEKRQNAVTKAIEKSEKAESKWGIIKEKVSKNLQNVYNATGLIGGAGRTIKAGGQAIMGITKDAMTAADSEAQKEREARRIRGFDSEDAMGILNELYFQTGADYSTIVDAINRVQSTLKTTDKEQLIIGAGLELRNPGMSLAFASSNTAPSLQRFNAYGRRMDAIQKATGASDEQIKASTQKMANYKNSAFGNTSITELQSIYLGLQNSGAFESEDELDKAFDRFVWSRKDSKQKAWKDAQEFDWTAGINNQRNRLQAQNTLKTTMDWEAIRYATNTIDTLPKQQTALESTSELMRRVEYQKNQVLVKLLPALQPLFERLTDLLNSDAGKRVIDGILKFITDVVPVLVDIFISIADKLGVIINKTTKAIEASVEAFAGSAEAVTGKGSDGRFRGEDSIYSMGKFANGGFAFMPSIVGERGPEAIIPLDFSRVQRASNVANTVNQTFNMGSSQSTALSLAQAVRSRDFTRAMMDNQFFTRRIGAF